MAESADQAGNGMPSIAPSQSVSPASYYAGFWHENAINGEQHGFPRDDGAGQSSDISAANPQCMVIAVGC
jgi:Beta-1,3-glucanase